MKHFFKLRNVLIRAACFWCALVLADFVLVYFFGSQFWSQFVYFFGNDIRIRLGVLMFIEGGVLFALGLVWASGSMETVFQGGNLKTNPYFRKDDWKQRKEETGKQNEAGKVLMLAGGPILIASFILVIA
jgi:hypothetical protein